MYVERKRRILFFDALKRLKKREQVQYKDGILTYERKTFTRVRRSLPETYNCKCKEI